MYTGEAFDVCVGKPFMQEHPVRFVLTIVMLGSRVGVYIDVTVVDLVEDEAHVRAAGLCCATVAACEGVCSVIYGREAVALCAGHCGKSEGVAVFVYSCENGVVCGMCCVGVVGAPQGVEDAHRHLCFRDHATQHTLSKLSGIGVLADKELVPGGVLW